MVLKPCIARSITKKIMLDLNYCYGTDIHQDHENHDENRPDDFSALWKSYCGRN